VRGLEAYRLVCNSKCRLRKRNRCKEKSKSGRQCELAGGHPGKHEVGFGFHMKRWDPERFAKLEEKFPDAWWTKEKK
jgi:hypothetical protein